MIRVAIETSTPLGSVAVARDDRLLAEVATGVQSRHAETVLPALETALGLARLERTAIEEVVVGAGPGSFTGVRVAGATGKGLAAALGVPFVAWSSLLAVAAAVVADRPVCALFDARRGEVYAGCWRLPDDAEAPEVLLAPTVAPIEDVVEATGALAPLFVGDGALRYADALADLGARSSTAPAHPRASALLWLAARYPEAARVSEVAAWEPLYVRASSAERGIAG